MSTAPVLRLIAVDDHEIVLMGLNAVISQYSSLKIVGCASSGDEAANLASRLHPDVAIMDIKMPLCNGLEATGRLAKASPKTKVLVFSRWPSPSLVVAALQAGALGCVSKSSSPSVLIEAIPVVASGKRFIDPRLRDSALRTLLDDRTIGAPKALGKREREVLVLVAWGYPNSEIAQDLGISKKTVESYRAKACDKLNLIGRPAIVKFAVMSGWMD